MIRSMLAGAAALTLLVLSPAAAMAAPPSAPVDCGPVTASLTGLTVTLTGECRVPISVAVWQAPSLSGNPITDQSLFWSVTLDTGVSGNASTVLVLPEQGDCFVQVDVAFGPPKIPYGERLIRAWHSGTTNCLTPTPTTTPPATTTPPVTTTPAVTTVPPTTTTPATTTPPPTTVPPTTRKVTKPPTPTTTKPTTAAPTTTRPHTAVPTHKPKPPAKPPALPFTGSNTVPLAAAGALAVATGAFLVVKSRRRSA